MEDDKEEEEEEHALIITAQLEPKFHSNHHRGGDKEEEEDEEEDDDEEGYLTQPQPLPSSFNCPHPSSNPSSYPSYKPSSNPDYNAKPSPRTGSNPGPEPNSNLNSDPDPDLDLDLDPHLNPSRSHGLCLSLPLLYPNPSLTLVKPPGGSGRDDIWSEGATFLLIEAWGGRYLDLNRGNLKQKHWCDVADTVNCRQNGTKLAPRTDVQCKNRMDTLKKKYKLEKSRFLTSGNPSKWPFFVKLDELIGPSKKPKKLPSLIPSMKVKKKEKCKGGEENPIQYHPPQYLNPNKNNTKYHMAACDLNTASSSSQSKESTPRLTGSFCPNEGALDGKGVKREKICKGPLKDLAKAVLKFGEIYERVEIVKQKQIMDMEKQRMEFTKDLELQRLRLFMQAQVELAKMKYGKQENREN